MRGGRFTKTATKIKSFQTGNKALLEHIAAGMFGEAIDPKLLTAYLAQVNHLITAMNNCEIVRQIHAEAFTS